MFIASWVVIMAIFVFAAIAYIEDVITPKTYNRIVMGIAVLMLALAAYIGYYMSTVQLPSIVNPSCQHS